MSAQRPPRAAKKLFPVNIRMEEETLIQLRAIAAEEDRTVSNLIHRVVKEWLAQRQPRS